MQRFSIAEFGHFCVRDRLIHDPFATELDLGSNYGPPSLPPQSLKLNEGTLRSGRQSYCDNIT